MPSHGFCNRTADLVIGYSMDGFDMLILGFMLGPSQPT